MGLCSDPRPDLKGDSTAWKRLLKLAVKVSTASTASKECQELAARLHAFRCVGLRLHWDGKAFSLRPEFDPKSSQWTSQSQYEKDRDKWLMPYKQEIIDLLNRL